MKKLLSILLACVMLLGLIAPVFAEDGEQPATDPAPVTDPMDDPTEDPATDSADVTDPTDDPADVTDPADDPSDNPADVTDPVDPEDPVDDPTDLEDPEDVTDPVDPDDPTDDPTNPADPTDPEDPAADPEEPNAEIELEDIDDERSNAGETTYALWDENTKTLTLYYGPLPETYAVSGFESSTEPFSAYKIAVEVVFDPSFANARPTCLVHWFNQFETLLSIDGLEHLNTSSVTSMRAMFQQCRSIEHLDVSGFDTSNVTDLTCMFSDCNSLKSLDVTNFNTEKVQYMYGMFCRCRCLTSLDVTNFNTNNVYQMGYMFQGCSQLTTLDLSSFNTSRVTQMHFMFEGCTSLNTIYVDDGKWSTSSVQDDFSNTLSNCPSLTGGEGTAADTSSITYAHIDKAGNPGYFTNIADKSRLNLGTSETQKQFCVEIKKQSDKTVYAKLPKNNYPRFSTTNYPTLVGNQYAGKYVFAGYYDSVGEGATTERTATETTGYARFIPIEVLDVYVQFRHTSLAASDPQNKTDLRFLTSVPDPATLGYNGQIVGFRLVNLANGKVISDAAFGAEYCYDEIIGDYKVQTGSGLVSLTPDKFYSGVSQKVALQTVIGMPNSYFENQKRLSVQPYIITLDGTKSYATVHPFMLKIVNGKKTAAPIANN